MTHQEVRRLEVEHLNLGTAQAGAGMGEGIAVRKGMESVCGSGRSSRLFI